MDSNGTLGVIAATVAPFFMALGFIIWEKTWTVHKGSAFALNMFKCNLASLGFLVISFILGWTSNGSKVDEAFSVESVLFLVLSGFIGIIVGDLAWLEALRLLGATKVLVIDSAKPFTAAIMGRLILNEPIHNLAWLGLVLTITGILVVSLERERQDDHNKSNTDDSNNNKDEEGGTEEISGLPLMSERKSWWHFRGYILAIGNVVLDTYGSILTKQFGQGMSTWAISLIRFGSSGICMIIVSMALRISLRKKEEEAEPGHESENPWYLLPQMNIQAWSRICLGVLFVTFICPALSNYALFQITLALALTLGSITPLYALILEWPFHGKQPTLCATMGVMFAIVGVVVLSIWQK
mmetsp:Transcript_27212/g.40932  ORF Transcript_27212/g.40932 Transcript_27212/m.40932 type:complete len:354 (-) Transcript_27212:1247-2308(-)